MVLYTKTPLCAQHYGNAGWLNKIQQEHSDEPIQMLYIYILGFRFLKDIFHYTYQMFISLREHKNKKKTLKFQKGKMF